ncbi:CRISPR-associated endonuclease Cas2 [Thermosynechococcaceae cyanobacterium Okahandja]
MLLYVIAYDIPNDKRRRKVAELLEGYGQRVQFSVFEARLTPKQLQQLRDRLRRRLKFSEDHVRIYPLSHHTESSILILGIGCSSLEPPTSQVV